MSCLLIKRLFSSIDSGDVADWSVIGRDKSCACLVHGTMKNVFRWKGKVLHLAERFNMFANSNEISPPPGLTRAGGNESGPGRYMTFVLRSNGAISFSVEETVKKVSEARHGVHKVKSLLLILGMMQRIGLRHQRFLKGNRDKCFVGELVDKSN